MASGHGVPHQQAEHMAATDQLHREKTLANREPSTHGTSQPNRRQWKGQLSDVKPPKGARTSADCRPCRGHKLRLTPHMRQTTCEPEPDLIHQTLFVTAEFDAPRPTETTGRNARHQTFGRFVRTSFSPPP